MIPPPVPRRHPGLRPALFLMLCLAWLAPAVRAERYALLVGINDYPAFPDRNLSGCLNDVSLFKTLLVQRFGFSAANIRVILNQEATSDGLCAAFEEHLVARTRPGDVVVFYYSGHGSQAKDTHGDEPDGQDEILCTHDIHVVAGKPEGYVSDDRLHELIGKLAGREAIVILDCCHSGTGTRDLLCSGRVRYLPLQEDAAAATRSLLDEPFAAPPPAAAAARPDSLGGLAGGGEVVLIAACEAGETAQESEFKVNATLQEHGALTYKLAEGLLGEAAASGPRHTYADLKRFLAEPLITEEREQHPQLECEPRLLAREVFTPPAAPAPTPPPASGAPAEVPGDLAAATRRRPLMLYVAPYETFLRREPPADAKARAESLHDALARKPFLGVTRRRPEADIAVFVATARRLLTVGAILPGGTITCKAEVADLGENALQPLLTELKRMYLVRNLLSLRNPAATEKVAIELTAGGRTLGLGEKIAFRVTSGCEGYLTLINVDCQGGLHLLVPNHYQPECRIRANQPVEVPAGAFELAVEPPVGREMIKAVVTRYPLALGQGAPSPAEGAFRSITGEPAATAVLDDLYRAVVARPATASPPAAAQAAGLDQLASGEWTEGSLIFQTTQ